MRSNKKGGSSSNVTSLPVRSVQLPLQPLRSRIWGRCAHDSRVAVPSRRPVTGACMNGLVDRYLAALSSGTIQSGLPLNRDVQVHRKHRPAESR